MLQYKTVSVVKRYRLSGRRANEIATTVEAAIRAGRIEPGGQLPTVRSLADELAVSPTTVAAAYRLLRERGLISAAGRRGTTVNARPAVQSAEHNE